MNQPTTFEDRLLAVLEAEVAELAARSTAEQERRRNRTRRIGALAGAAALAATGAVGVPVVLGQQAGSTAWAVETRADGSVEVQIWEFTDPAGLERRLAEAGIPAYISFVPPGMICAQRTVRSDFSPLDEGIESPVDGSDGAEGFVIHPDRLAPNERLVLTGYAIDKSGTIGATQLNVVPLNEERCEIVPHNPPLVPHAPPPPALQGSPRPTTAPQR